MSSRAVESGGPPFVVGYTVALTVFAVLAGAVAWIEVGLIRDLEADGAGAWATVLRVDQITALVLSPLSLLTVVARWRAWPIAYSLTRVVSIVLVIVVPIGTALFIYWLARVRTREVRHRG